MTILVTGGAGYIGAHVVRLLTERGHRVAVVDDLSFGTADRVGGAPLTRLDIADPGAVERLVPAMAGVSAVVHIAARKQVGESVARPAWYFQQNVGGMANVLLAMEQAGVDRLVFSSSAAVYGTPEAPKVAEEVDLAPINPYGQTKVVGEWMAADAARAWGLRVASLRYFNVAGAGWADLGDPAALNLIPMVLERLAAGRQPVIFGDDYPTPDGTCVRDYIHVHDLADAHIAALDYLDRDDRAESVFNVGTGVGASVRDVIAAVASASGLAVEPEVADRRPGDPPYLVGDPGRIQNTLGWTAAHGLEAIAESAWEAWQAGPRRIERGV
ncbi:MAG: UDP-glucose 4-epimerase GalE [Bifidobacteriaceae bacterium]|jgi:UDP-glucose 4-epimerase|nr:UDP-glucose 4-epimerase GalE [Bifidobacteriaceae bacterium]